MAISQLDDEANACGFMETKEISSRDSGDVRLHLLGSDLECSYKADADTKLNILRHLGRLVRPGAGALPGFLRTETYYKKRKLSPTSWLVALRGYAGCLVAMDHMGGPPESWTVMEWPILRCFRHGRAMPDLFFVASGFVLSYQMLKFMRSHDSGALLERLTSLSFRRYLRLYLPVAVATFITMMFMLFNLIPNPPCPPRDTASGQVADWFVDWLNSSNPLHSMNGFWHPTVFRTHYIDQMWTIPMEFRGSMMIFAACTAFGSLTSRARMTTCWMAVALCYYWQEVWAAMFFGGMALAESSLNRQDRQQDSSNNTTLPSSEGSSVEYTDVPEGVENGPLIAPADAKLRCRNKEAPYIEEQQTVSQKVRYCCILLVALVFLGQPNNLGVDGPFPYQYTYNLIPGWWSAFQEADTEMYGTETFGQENFWFGIGSLMFIYAVDNCPMLQWPFRCNFGLYLGEISFGIYAMNNLVVWTLQARILRPIRDTTTTMFWFPEIFIYFFVVLWVGDYFRRIDNKLVTFQFWLQKRVFRKR